MKVTKAQQTVIDTMQLYSRSYILYDSWMGKNATLYTVSGVLKMSIATFEALRDKGLIERASEIDQFKKVYKLVVLP